MFEQSTKIACYPRAAKKCAQALSGALVITASLFFTSKSFAVSQENFDLPSCYSSSEVLTEAVSHYQSSNPLVIKINTLLNESIIACESGQFKLGYEQLITATSLFEKLKESKGN